MRTTGGRSGREHVAPPERVIVTGPRIDPAAPFSPAVAESCDERQAATLAGGELLVADC
jgi:hypothetical protein